MKFRMASALWLLLSVAWGASVSSQTHNSDVTHTDTTEIHGLRWGLSLSSSRGRSLMATVDRGRLPECQRNRTRCLDPKLTPDGPTCCFNRCVNIRANDNHCGQCGRTCGFRRACCTGRCVNLGFDPQNCGACGVICDEECSFGLCAYSGDR